MPTTSRGLAATIAAALGLSALTIAGATAPAGAVLDAPLDPSAENVIQLIATNDFHGRILEDTTNAGGAAELAGAVKALRAQQPNTVFAAAGDLIGASTFESFIQKDQPTIDALNAAGLDVSSAGNHEFDAGAADLTNRVIAGGANAKWTYVAANVVKHDTGTPLLDPSYVKSFSGINGTGTSTTGCAAATSVLTAAAAVQTRAATTVKIFETKLAQGKKNLTKAKRKHRPAKRIRKIKATIRTLTTKSAVAERALIAPTQAVAAASTAKAASCKDFRVGFIGAVTEDLPSLVSPAGLAGLDVGSIPAAVNAEATKLKAAGVNAIVLLVHEGSESTDCTKIATDTTSNFGRIVWGVSSDVDAIVSGHTHLAYNCQVPVPAWTAKNHGITKRPVTSAGQYGTKITQTLLKIDAQGHIGSQQTATIDLTFHPEVKDANGNVVTPSEPQPFTPDAGVQKLVDAAKAKADELGKVKIGSLSGTFDRAKLGTGSTTVTATENRGGESTLGNLVAEVQRWATEAPESGAAQIAFMNPGGLRADMPGTAGDPANLTYKQAATVQPFANTLVNERLTGAQIKKVLEQQWQRDASGKVPSRPFLRLGISHGFTYTYIQAPDPAVSAPKGTVTGMWLNGTPVDLAATYSVTVNSFLASGGDNFWELNNGANKRDTGKSDLQAMVDYLTAKTASAALPVDYSQRAVEVSGVAGPYAPGATVTLSVKSWLLPGAAVKDDTIVAKIGGTQVGTGAVDNTVSSAAYDDNGTATVTVTIPAGQAAGTVDLHLTGAATGTDITVPLTVG